MRALITHPTSQLCIWPQVHTTCSRRRWHCPPESWEELPFWLRTWWPAWRGSGRLGAAALPRARRSGPRSEWPPPLLSPGTDPAPPPQSPCTAWTACGSRSGKEGDRRWRVTNGLEEAMVRKKGPVQVAKNEGFDFYCQFGVYQILQNFCTAKSFIWHKVNTWHGQQGAPENTRITQTKQDRDYRRNNFTLAKILLTTNEIIASEATNIL